MSFTTANKHIWIGSIDEHGKDQDEGQATVMAQYNPGQLEITQNVPWKKPDAATQGGGQAKSKKDANYMALEFTGAEGRSISVELLFDGYEKGESVAPQISKLEYLATVRNPESEKDTERRPHHCVVVWGGVLPRFECVIEGLTTKYTMFSPDGVPLRATCTVKLKEASRVDKKKKGK